MSNCSLETGWILSAVLDHAHDNSGSDSGGNGGGDSSGDGGGDDSAVDLAAKELAVVLGRLSLFTPIRMARLYY